MIQQKKSSVSRRLGAVVLVAALVVVGAATPANAAPGDVTTFAGATATNGHVDATGTAAQFNFPQGVVADGSGNIYVSEYYGWIRKITPAGVVTTLAGTGDDGYQDGPGAQAKFTVLRQIAIDSSGTLYVADQNNHVIRKITPAGVVSTLAGNPGVAGHRDSVDGTPEFALPTGVAVDTAGNVYVGDWGNHAIRKVTPAGDVTTLAGLPGFEGGFANGAGPAARFHDPAHLAVDPAGNVFVADYQGAVRKVDPSGNVTTVAGSDVWGHADGVGSAARFKQLLGITLDPSGNLFTTEFSGPIRRVTPAGEVTTIAGAPDGYGYDDGNGTAARFYVPNGIASNPAGDLFIADGSQRIRRIEALASGVSMVRPLPLVIGGSGFMAMVFADRVRRRRLLRSSVGASIVATGA